jgi:hypothetical protein
MSSVEGSSHLGPDEAIKRQNAEWLLADIYDVVMLFVGVYAAKFLKIIYPHLPPNFPYQLSPEAVRHHLDELGIMHDTVMTWATEALEHAGVPQPQRQAGEAVRVFDFEYLSELGRQDAQAQDDLNGAWQMIGYAIRQLDTIKPENRTAQKRARWALGRAISKLIAASGHMMRLDAERWRAQQAAHIHEHAQQLTWQPRTGGVLKISEHLLGGSSAPFVPTGVGGRRPGVMPTAGVVQDLQKHLGPKRQVGNWPSSGPSNQGGAGAAPSR